MKENKDQSIKFGLIILFSILTTWCLYFIIINVLIADKSNMGAFGDSFGALNTLFAGLAFGGIIYTIIIQRKELNLQREELEIQRREFQINRITNIVFKQLEICQKAITEFIYNSHIESQLREHGLNGIKLFTSELFLKTGTASDVGLPIDTYSLNKKENVQIIYNSKRHLFPIVEQIQKSVIIIRLTIENDTIEEEDKLELESIFHFNLDKAVHNMLYALNEFLETILERKQEKPKMHYYSVKNGFNITGEELDVLGHLASDLYIIEKCIGKLGYLGGYKKARSILRNYDIDLG